MKKPIALILVLILLLSALSAAAEIIPVEPGAAPAEAVEVAPVEVIPVQPVEPEPAQDAAQPAPTADAQGDADEILPVVPVSPVPDIEPEAASKSKDVAARGAEELVYTIANGKATITGTVGGYGYSGANLVIPDALDGCPVTAIGESAFFRNTNIERVQLPDGLVSIGYNAFYGCRKLASMNVPASLKIISTRAFYECPFITDIDVSGVQSIGEQAFDDGYSYASTGLTEVTVTAQSIAKGNMKYGKIRARYGDAIEKVTVTSSGTPCAIGADVFKHLPLLQSVVLPEGITLIGNAAFAGDASLSSVNIPSTVTEIGQSAFAGTGLTALTIPGTVKTIELNAFGDCQKLASLTLSNGITNLCSSAFNGCKALTSVTIPASVKRLDPGAFTNCVSLASVTFADGITEVNGFSHCPALTTVTIPGSVVRVGNEAFAFCSGLTSVVLKPGVQEIQAGAFTNCTGRLSVTIPRSVYAIAWDAFANCPYLSISGVAGSYADTFASMNGIRFYPISDEGDTDTATIKLSKTRVSMYSEDSYKLDATVTSKQGKTYDINWSSTSTSIVSVDQRGNITADMPGTATIVARVQGATFPSAMCVVTVYDHVTGIALLPSEMTICVTQDAFPTLRAYPSGLPSGLKASWTSSDTAIATVNSLGMVFGVAEGTATITATLNDKAQTKASCAVTVVPAGQGVESVEVDLTAETMSVNQVKKITAKVFPQTAKDQRVSWMSADEDVAKVDQSGNVTALTEGATTVTAIGSSGKSASVTITVGDKTWPAAKSVKLNKSSVTHKHWATGKLKLTVSPSSAAGSIQWTSKKTGIVTVDQNGQYTCVGVGSTYVYATAPNGKYARCKITVKARKVTKVSMPVKSGTVTFSEADPLPKISLIAADALPANASNRTLKWTSSNKQVATVDKNGNVTCLKAGKVSITATAKDGSKKSAKYVLTVKRAQ